MNPSAVLEFCNTTNHFYVVCFTSSLRSVIHGTEMSVKMLQLMGLTKLGGVLFIQESYSI